ncbi:hypothetical protein OHA21_52615 [Actinoplanes sp. NBC_00393]|uniref:hypothetical protein n=1 Tax=Actinoplanes sp. NBC_00393 TaxID=2975953 RepID=UPI002E1C8513
MQQAATTVAAPDWGSVPEWIGGIGTACATILFAFGWLMDARRRRQDHERQTAVAIRQLLLDVEHLYASEREQDGSLEPTADPKLSRIVREIETHAALLPKSIRPRMMQLAEFLGNGAIPTFQGDRESLVASRCTRHGLDLIAAYLRNDELPQPPNFVAEYQSAIDDANAAVEQHYRELEDQERRGRHERPATDTPAPASPEGAS